MQGVDVTEVSRGVLVAMVMEGNRSGLKDVERGNELSTSLGRRRSLKFSAALIPRILCDTIRATLSTAGREHSSLLIPAGCDPTSDMSNLLLILYPSA